MASDQQEPLFDPHPSARKSLSPASPRKRCWFCGECHLSPDDPPEHVIPAALGAELTTDAVAAACNRRAGKEVDQPLLNDPFVAFNRIFFDIRDRRGGRPPNPVRNATLADGAPATLETREIPWGATALPRIREEGDRVTITAGSIEEAEEIAAKKSERSGQRYRPLETRRTQRGHAEVKFTVTLDIRLRIRARSKIVLGALSKVLPEEWLDTADATQLQDWLWDPRPKQDGKEIGAMHTAPDGLLAYMCEPPEHLIALQPTGADGLMVMVMLFGKEVLPHEIRLPGIEVPELCWVMDPRNRTVRELDYGALVLEVGSRLDQAQADRD